MRKFIEPLIIAFLLVTGFVGTAFAAGEALPSDQSLLDLAKPVFDAVMHGQWWIAAASALILAVAALQKYAPKDGKFGAIGRAVSSTPGVMVSTFVLSFAGATATALLAMGPSGMMSFAIAKTAALIAVSAVGAWKALHSLATWAVSTDFYKTKVPASIQTIVGYVLSLIGSNAIEKAEAAGQQAVTDKPATGATDGNFTKF